MAKRNISYKGLGKIIHRRVILDTCTSMRKVNWLKVLMARPLLPLPLTPSHSLIIQLWLRRGSGGSRISITLHTRYGSLSVCRLTTSRVVSKPRNRIKILWLNLLAPLFQDCFPRACCFAFATTSNWSSSWVIFPKIAFFTAVCKKRYRVGEDPDTLPMKKKFLTITCKLLFSTLYKEEWLN